ncbi:MAG: hypothetical protein IT370_02955 [Deltaproteobacteria bacterium]|nr:hypothetical protein [Deltaproteobacteria bacterium]
MLEVSRVPDDSDLEESDAATTPDITRFVWRPDHCDLEPSEHPPED